MLASGWPAPPWSQKDDTWPVVKTSNCGKSGRYNHGMKIKGTTPPPRLAAMAVSSNQHAIQSDEVQDYFHGSMWDIDTGHRTQGTGHTHTNNTETHTHTHIHTHTHRRTHDFLLNGVNSTRSWFALVSKGGLVTCEQKASAGHADSVSEGGKLKKGRKTLFSNSSTTHQRRPVLCFTVTDPNLHSSRFKQRESMFTNSAKRRESRCIPTHTTDRHTHSTHIHTDTHTHTQTQHTYARTTCSGMGRNERSDSVSSPPPRFLLEDIFFSSSCSSRQQPTGSVPKWKVVPSLEQLLVPLQTVRNSNATEEGIRSCFWKTIHWCYCHYSTWQLLAQLAPRFPFVVHQGSKHTNNINPVSKQRKQARTQRGETQKRERKRERAGGRQERARTDTDAQPHRHTNTQAKKTSKKAWVCGCRGWIPRRRRPWKMCCRTWPCLWQHDLQMQMLCSTRLCHGRLPSLLRTYLGSLTRRLTTAL